MEGDLRTGTRTLLFTDVEGSTKLLQRLGSGYADVLTEHRELLRSAFSDAGGIEHDTQGDSFFVSFDSAHQAVAAAVSAQQALDGHPWPEEAKVRVRMGLHTGDVVAAGGGYIGMPIHQAARIAAAAHGAQVLASDLTRELTREQRDVSWRDLGRHSLKDMGELQLFQLCHPDLEWEFPPLTTGVSARTNLPVQLTTLVGREEEVKQLRQLLSSRRLVTITGAGGAGKTRLACQVAAETLAEFPDGAWFIDLAPVRDPESVLPLVANVLGATGTGAPPEQAVIEQCRDQTLLIVLDNCEHLTEAASVAAADLLARCPAIRVLATSRELLGIPGESGWRVPPLELVDPSSDPEVVASSEAVQLFIERARDADRGFALSSDNAVTIASIVSRLDGLPLAIELAASRARSMSVEQIRERLDDRFRLLSGGGAGSFGRQRTLQATVDWSFDLLSESEKLLLARLGVFPDDFSLEAAEGVGAVNAVTREEVADLVDGLVSKSMLVADTNKGRYRMLQTIRSYALDRLVEFGEASISRSRHLGWCGDISEARNDLMLEGHVDEALRLIGTDIASLNAGLTWAIEDKDPLAGARVVSFAWIIWHEFDGSRLLEAQELLSRLLPLIPPAEGMTRLRILAGLGGMASNRSDFKTSDEANEEAISLARTLPKSRERDFCLIQALWFVTGPRQMSGDTEGAEASSRESHDLARELGIDMLTSSALSFRARFLAARGQLDEAVEVAEESVRFGQRAGSSIILSQAFWTQAMLLEAINDIDAAANTYDRGISTVRGVGALSLHKMLLAGFGSLQVSRGRFAEAEALLREAQTIPVWINHLAGTIEMEHGRTLQLLDRLDEASQKFQIALKTFEQRGEAEQTERVRRMLAEVDLS